jgi:hypothetical protein
MALQKLHFICVTGLTEVMTHGAGIIPKEHWLLTIALIR